ncbi:MAG: SDR family oxidoreductase [Dehalococcoidia bacterium]|nr:SDR family oxidoreductase [Dehalococcoidia bacterium]
MELEGKVSLVTGASRGIGKAIALKLASLGARVAVNYVAIEASNKVDADNLVESITRLGGEAMSVEADIRDSEAAQAMVEQVTDKWSKIDILVNNAGMEWVSRYTDLSPEFIQTMIQTNQVAPMVLTRLVLPDMLARGSGHVVTISSLGGTKGSPYSATYAATKAGLIAWTSGLREELRSAGVSASVICPGFVAEAGMFAVYNKKAPKLLGETTPEKVADAVIRAIKKDIGRIIVNPGPVWPMQILDAIHPGIGTWILRKFGVYDWYQGQSDDNLKQRQAEEVI